MKSSMEESLKAKTARGLFWGSLSSGLQQLLNLVFGIFLARRLTEADYGMVGMLTVFSLLAAALQDGGFISALNKRRNASFDDFNAVFWFTTGCSLCLYALLFCCAPLIAAFYGEPELTPLARYVFLGFVFTSFGIAPRAWLFRNLKVREQAVASFVALVVSGVAGVAMAYAGFSYWGIAMQSNLFVLLLTLLSYWYSGFRPRLRFSFRPVREMFSFSVYLIVTRVFQILNDNFFSVLLGRWYTKVDVGNFTQANKWNTMGHLFITNMLLGVAQPVLTKAGGADRQRRVFRKLLRFTALVSFPAMFGLSLVSHELIVITITERWARSAGILSLLCVWGAFIPLNNLFGNLIISQGRTRTYMWVTVSLCLALLLGAWLSHPLGMTWMFRVFVALNVAWLFVWYWFARRAIGLRLRQLLSDLAPYLLLSLALCLAARFAFAGIGNLYLSLLAKVAGVASAYCLVLYASGSVIFREMLRYLLRRRKR